MDWSEEGRLTKLYILSYVILCPNCIISKAFSKTCQAYPWIPTGFIRIVPARNPKQCVCVCVCEV